MGDVPLIGCGTYADDAVGAAAATGSGEGIIRVVLARSCLADLEAGGHPQAVAEARVEAMTARTGLEGGIILLDRQGRTGLWHTTPAMCFARLGGEGPASGWTVRSSRAGAGAARPG
ncbi:MAG: isoaspartyl peptidase/L-asparaginase [bacterium]